MSALQHVSFLVLFVAECVILGRLMALAACRMSLSTLARGWWIMGGRLIMIALVRGLMAAGILSAVIVRRGG